MTIVFKNGRGVHRIDATTQAPNVLLAAAKYMLWPCKFNLLLLNLSGDTEYAEFFDSETQRQVCSMGGASAWGVYQAIAEIFPQIGLKEIA